MSSLLTPTEVTNAPLLRRASQVTQQNPTEPDLRARDDQRILTRFTTEAVRRWVYGAIIEKSGRTMPFVIADQIVVDGHRCYLITTRGWQYYSPRAPARYRVMAWLYGTDDAGPWSGSHRHPHPGGGARGTPRRAEGTAPG